MIELYFNLEFFIDLIEIDKYDIADKCMLFSYIFLINANKEVYFTYAIKKINKTANEK